MNYSTIIAPQYNGWIPVEANNYPAVAQIVLGEIEDHVEDLRRLSGPSHFLAHVARFQNNSNPLIQFDFGILHYLMGNIDAAIAVFEKIEPSQHPLMSYFDAMIPLVLNQLKTRSALLQAEIDRWRSQMAKFLKIEPSCKADGN